MTIRCLSVALILAATPPAATAQNPWQGGIAPLAQQPARINREVRSTDFPESYLNSRVRTRPVTPGTEGMT